MTPRQLNNARAEEMRLGACNMAECENDLASVQRRIGRLQEQPWIGLEDYGQVCRIVELLNIVEDMVWNIRFHTEKAAQNLYQPEGTCDLNK